MLTGIWPLPALGSEGRANHRCGVRCGAVGVKDGSVKRPVHRKLESPIGCRGPRRGEVEPDDVEVSESRRFQARVRVAARSVAHDGVPMKQSTTLGLVALLAVGCSKSDVASDNEQRRSIQSASEQESSAVKVDEASVRPASAASPDADPHAGLANYDVQQVASLLADKKITPVDANSPETRTKFGTLPGAILLSSSTQFDVNELPESKADALVFYCSNPKCTAAPKAAKKAASAGYQNVHVMRDGIKGWASAGNKTTQVAG